MAWVKILGATRMCSSTGGRVSLGALGLVAVAALAFFCASAPVQANDQVPFKGRFSFTLSGPPAPVRQKLAFTVAVSGTMTHLGKFTGTSQFLFDPNNLSYTGDATWIAANGDSINLVFEGLLEPTATAAILANVETAEVVGGELNTATFEPTSRVRRSGLQC